MIEFRLIAVGAVMAAALALSGCGKYGLKGDRGLPPPSETMAYPNINQVPAATDGRPGKSVAEQEQLKSRLLASRPRTARSPRPFTPAQGLAEQRKRMRPAAVSP